MPEGDTIALTAVALDRRLAGKQVLRARPERFRRLAGTRLLRAEPAGKHLFLNFDSGLSLHTHLGMTGSWHLYRPGERWRLPERAASLALDFEDAVAVCFRAPVADLVRGRDSVRHLGPDVLDPAFDPALAAERARAAGAPTAGEALLDQRAAAGIGNVFRCEALWWRRVSPFRPLAGCSDGELAGLFETAAAFVRANAAAPGPRRFPYGPAAVHGRAGRPCRRCGSRVRAARLGEQARLAYWCAGCQPG